MSASLPIDGGHMRPSEQVAQVREHLKKLVLEDEDGVAPQEDFDVRGVTPANLVLPRENGLGGGDQLRQRALEMGCRGGFALAARIIEQRDNIPRSWCGLHIVFPAERYRDPVDGTIIIVGIQFGTRGWDLDVYEYHDSWPFGVASIPTTPV